MAEPFIEDQFYHVFNRGNNRENIFLEHRNYEYFLGLVHKYILHIADIYSYCLLPNHFHFVLKIKEQSFLPENIRNKKRGLHQPFSNLFNAYTKAINKKYKRRGSLFQEHLKRNLVDSDEYLQSVIVYVHLNPLHHRIDKDFAHYAYSSYNSILSYGPTMVKRKEVIEIFGNPESFRIAHLERKVKMELLKEVIEME